jgi:TonB family protein
MMTRFLFLAMLLLPSFASAQATGGVTGRIVTKGGSPVAGVRVFVIRESKATLTPTPSGNTDKNGQYRIEGISPGSYFVGTNVGTGPIILFPGTASEKSAKMITVKSDAITKGVDLRIPALQVKGRVLNTRQAAPGVSMSARLVQQRSPSGVVIVQAHLNTFVESNGSFSFQNVGPGTYTLQTDPVQPIREVSVVVSDRDLTGIEAVIPPVREVTVRITAPPGARNNFFPDISVLDEERRTRVPVWGNADSRNVFRIVLPEGESRLEAGVPGHSVVSMTHETTDLLRNPFRLATKGKAEIGIKLAESQPAPPSANAAPAPAANTATADPQALARLCLACPEPSYPALARVARIEDTVKITVVVGQDGRVRETKIVSGHVLLRESVIEAVREWRFAPFQVDGKPVDVQSTVSVIFMQ